MELIEHTKIGTIWKSQYDDLLFESDGDPFFYGVQVDRNVDRTLVIVDEQVVGFFETGTTEYKGRNYYRANRPYTARAHRGKGYMSRALQEYFKHRRPAIGWIDNDNVSSIRLFQGIGFSALETLRHKDRNGILYVLGHTQLPTFETIMQETENSRRK